MPELVPLVESTETLSVHQEEGYTFADPAAYPSAVTYPSVAHTFPSEGVARSGLWLEDNAEGAETLTPLTED